MFITRAAFRTVANAAALQYPVPFASRLVVTQDDGQMNHSQYPFWRGPAGEYVAPQFTFDSHSPTSGYAGDTVTFTGTKIVGTVVVALVGFSGGSTVACGDVTVVDDTTVEVLVPDGAGAAVGGTEGSPVYPKWQITNEIGSYLHATRFTPTLPHITSFADDTLSVGGSAVATGAGFVDVTGITVNGTAVVTYAVDSATQITFTVPAGATTGDVVVTTQTGADRSPPTLTVGTAAPTISSMSVSSGKADGTVTTRLTGTFPGTCTAKLLTPQQHTCTVTPVDATHIDVLIPSGPNDGPYLIEVTNAGGSATSPTTFLVTNYTDIISSSTGPRALTGGEMAQLVDGSGDEDFEIHVLRGDGGDTVDGDLLGGTSGGGLSTLNAVGGFALEMYHHPGGQSGAQLAFGYFRDNAYMAARHFDRSVAGGAGRSARVNGCRIRACVPVSYTPVGPISAWDTAHLLTRDGSSVPTTNATVERLRRRSDDPRVQYYEGAMVGDSILDDNSAVAQPAVGTLIYTNAEARTRAGINSIAKSGDTIANQKTAWLADTALHSSGAQLFWVYVQVGVNDILAGTSTASIITALEDLRDTIIADAPNCTVYMGTITPCDQYLVGVDAAFPGRRATVNAAITGSITGITPIDNEAAMDDASNAGYLDPTYDSGDHIHTNAAGRQKNADQVRAALVADGYL